MSTCASYDECGGSRPCANVCECGTTADDILHQLLAHSPGTEGCLMMPCPRPSAVEFIRCASPILEILEPG